MNSNQQPANQSQVVYEDEISLVDIVKVLLRRKKLIFGITALVVCIGLVYAFTSKRIYEVETILLPPSYEDIQPLNVLNNGNVKNSNIIESKDVFDVFNRNIKSRKLIKTFFDKFKVLETLSVDSAQTLTEKDINNYFEDFSKAIKVNTEKKANSTKITLEGRNKEKIGLWLDSFVAMANQETINQLIKDLQSNIDSKTKSLKINISSKRSIYKQRREDELGRLHEALQTAKNLGILDYNNTSSMPSKNNNLSIYMQEKKIYMQGTRVLQAEITALKNRKSDDIHIVGLRDLQEQLTRLEAIKIDKNKLQTVIVDKTASVDIEPIRPKRKLIVILSLILGGLLGIFAVFILEFINNFKKQANSVDVA